MNGFKEEMKKEKKALCTRKLKRYWRKPCKQISKPYNEKVRNQFVITSTI